MINKRIEGRIGFVRLDNPPVNAIGQAMRAALSGAVDWAEAEGLDRVILSGEGRAFAAGADAREFDGDPVPPHLPDVLNRIEASPVPWIAAIHGACLGGGAELAMACRYRIADPKAVIGLPEVTLGVVPGAGGTQRLPRLIGTEDALELISMGKTVSGQDALDLGLVDAVSDTPETAAAAVSAEDLAQVEPVGCRAVEPVSDATFDAARKTASSKLRGQIAPQRAIDLIQRAQTAPLAEGMAKERATFLELRGGEQSRALRHAFFAERGARAPESLPKRDGDLTRAAVVGGGTMGAGIAYALLLAGMEVVLLEADASAADRAAGAVHALADAGMARRRLSKAGAEAVLARLTATAQYDAAANAQIAIEAVFEDMTVKTAVFDKLEAALPPEAILATNTSYLDVNAIAAGRADPSRVIGLHFFAPAHVMKLLEIVRGDQTSDAALAVGFALAKRLRKIPVVAGVCDGFIGNRILTRYRDAADRVMMDGATPWQIDDAMEAFGFAMGPYAVQDLSGLDIAFANRRRKDATRDPDERYIPIADRLVDMGRLGRKTGIGWYRYPEKSGRVPDPGIETVIEDEARAAAVERRDFSQAEIEARLVLAMINEGARILEEGIAAKASDIDLVLLHGYGFPRWRGGLMHYADQIGAAQILEQLTALVDEEPKFWKPSGVLVSCAETGTPIADWRA